MNASFEMKCRCCSAGLEGKYYYQDRITEEKVCADCAVVKMKWSVETLDDKVFIPSNDAMLIAPKGINITVPLKGFINLEVSRAISFINSRLNRLMKEGIAQGAPLRATSEEMSSTVLCAEISNIESQIDKAIDAGDRYTFLALSGHLKDLLAKVGEANEV
ncbi:hypothetical protein ACIQ1H_09335 [Lysinibacillus sp. NPDC097279]|uniref:hypothetical protein n=1 Tax=Lysinibacillus sp. NPDC097279 TaxID=3364143 RepID=UPI00382F6E30